MNISSMITVKLALLAYLPISKPYKQPLDCSSKFSMLNSMEEKYDLLKSKLPEIAKTVNEFTSVALQEKTFEVLVAALLGDKTPTQAATGPESEDLTLTKTKVGARPGKVKKERRSPVPAFVQDLNLVPQNEVSLKDFVASKAPKDNQETFVVVIYYLNRVLKVPSVSRDHIYTAFKHLGKKVPMNIDLAVQVTSSRKGWINSRKLDDLDVTIHGENFVEHDLPHVEKRAGSAKDS